MCDAAARAAAPPRPIPARAGIGLRSRHHEELLAGTHPVAWLEAHTENYFHLGSPAARVLERLADRYPLSLHGVGLGLGSAAPLDRAHLLQLRDAVRHFRPALVSEHACWTHVDGEHFNDLLPLPHTEESVAHLSGRVAELQDVLGRQVLLENLSAYVAVGGSSLGEGEFLAAVVERSGCGLLLDVNNLCVNACNLGLDVDAFLAAVPPTAVQEIHLAGHSRRRIGGREFLVDDHGSAVPPDVWALYEKALARFGPVPTLIEWDTDVPTLDVLVAEARAAAQRLRESNARAA